LPALDLGLNSDSINYEVALEKLGQCRQPLMAEIRLERDKAEPSQPYIDYCVALLAALDQLQGDLEPRDCDVVNKILDDSLIGIPLARREALDHHGERTLAGIALSDRADSELPYRSSESAMKRWFREQFSDVGRARRAVLTFATVLGAVGFCVIAGALLFSVWDR